MATFLQTQRRRLRDHLKQRWAKTGIKTLIDGTRFCSTCRRISARLEELIDRGFDGLHMLRSRCLVARIDLRNHIPVEQSRQKKCNLCNEQYGIPRDSSHISNSFCMWILPNGIVPGYNPFGPSLPYEPRDYNLYLDQAVEVSNDPGKIGGCLVGPYADFELVRSWFNDCTLHHGTTTCQTDASNLQDIAAFRVIDCSWRSLVSWSQLPTNQDRNYVALSYVWGTKPDQSSWRNWSQRTILETRNPKTVEKPEAQTTDWRLPSKLPPLIEDTITAVIKLGFRYLWIDRYCIPQGDQEAKHTQIQNMDSIYGSASLTIIAAASNDPSHGLPGDMPRQLRESKWNNRAWTMQEAFLSCRCLVFFDDGAYFQCSSPRSHRFEALHEPSALLQLRHEVLSAQKREIMESMPADSLILTKIGKAGDFELDWCVQLVEDYFPRSLTFENDTLNAFSGMLKYLQSLKPSFPNLWGVLMLPDVLSTSPEQRIRYNLVLGLAWLYREHTSRGDPISHNLGKLEGTTKSPRKEMFPSWTWADWRPRVELDGRGGNDNICIIPQHSTFTSLVDLSVELDDGRIVSWGQGYLYDSDVSWLATLPNPPRILHIQGYTANPQLRYMTEEDWAEFNERTILPIKEAHAHSGNGGYPKDHWYGCDTKAHRWIWIDADGQHLQPLLELTFREQPRCWERVKSLIKWPSAHPNDLSADAYQIQSQRGNQTDTMKPYTECTFDFRAILLGYNEFNVFYMMLIKTPGPDSQNETFERVNVLEHSMAGGETVEKEEFLAKLTGKHAESYPGTPWVKMNTRIA
ncbi:hypothetical protein NEUTE1DRAFT_38422 [Neurospora tetrasperma FGSC 2508]|uniref:Heterokaryon incompatibility domain-containing protein n=1 Tax=Neurospora tetrasperma (strain FGSC 2508 / ATCC MYA-4615 / P0657) TaxID=510951 RepID=F8MG93_NEUT8|nr:uncharacterized protein NEUTE1DRAFT_38422 [Neurospora tetrasperma FGSC 2508]EGO58568.1 hypothetical protein NEUTE1DRAFT_38422 [Neurospora tetrasperma FGSC 2508]EGZ72636.1 HET-domain-containing protein [Neurospora tetrasperma FGSC 2509]